VIALVRKNRPDQDLAERHQQRGQKNNDEPEEQYLPTADTRTYENCEIVAIQLQNRLSNCHGC